MRALGKTPNDPLLLAMTPIQWKLCMHNVVEDEKENNKKIRDLVDIGIKVFCGTPETQSKEAAGSKEGFVGQDPDNVNPDIHYTIKGGHGEEIGIHKIMSTEFDKIIDCF